MEHVFIDDTHIKANANSHKYQEQTFQKEVRHYEQDLQEEIKKDRVEHGKKPLKEKEVIKKEGKRKVSTTDPDSGWFHKGEHKQFFAYSANTCCDKNNYILDFEVTTGNIHGTTSFWGLYKRMKQIKGITHYVLDAGYKIPAIARKLIEDGNVPVMPYKRPITKRGFFQKGLCIR